MKNKPHNLVGVIMGSKSDWSGTMEHCSDTLKQFGVKHVVKVISAHRTPKRLERFISEAERKDYEVIIAAAGGAFREGRGPRSSPETAVPCESTTEVSSSKLGALTRMLLLLLPLLSLAAYCC